MSVNRFGSSDFTGYWLKWQRSQTILLLYAPILRYLPQTWGLLLCDAIVGVSGPHVDTGTD